MVDLRVPVKWLDLMTIMQGKSTDHTKFKLRAPNVAFLSCTFSLFIIISVAPDSR